MRAGSDLRDTLLDGLDDGQRAAVQAPLDIALCVIGGTGSGKTEALARRVVRAVSASVGVLVLGHGDAARLRLAARIRELGISDVRVERFDELARRLGGRPSLARLEVKRRFERCIEPLFALAWPEFERGDLDVEIPGLAWPERFRDDAFELILKLREAGITPDQFLEGAHRGAEAFYGRANLAELARDDRLTDRQRASLLVDETTLASQRRRELELAEVLTRLYRSLLAEIGGEELAAAAHGDAAEEHRRAHPFCVVDDAHACRPWDLALLRALYGNDLRGVTLAGQRLAAGVAATMEIRLSGSYRGARRPSTTLFRAPDAAAEARFVAEEIVRLATERNIPLGEIAVIAREPRGTAAVEREFAARDVPFQHLGSTSLFDDPIVLDVLSLAGAAWEPRNAVRLLRALQTPPIALSDKTLHRLCAPPSGPQAPLFEEVGEAERVVKRGEVRDTLTRNVLEGSVDEKLSDGARLRLETFRAALPRWRTQGERLPLAEFLVHVADESGLLAWLDTLPAARRRHGRRQLRRLLMQAHDFTVEHPHATFGDFLAEADDLAARNVELPHDLPLDHDAVALLAAEESYGHEFEVVFAVGAHARSFPRYFSPPSFYYSPQYGVIARENVDDGGGPDTAKFVWYSVKQRLAEKYYARERSLFNAVLARARSLLYVTAYGKATRAVRNPEFLEEMRAAREEGVRDVTQGFEATWRAL